MAAALKLRIEGSELPVTRSVHEIRAESGLELCSKLQTSVQDGLLAEVDLKNE